MFLACGDALFDVFSTATSNPATRDLTARVGGSPLNVAVGLARLGNTTGFLTANSTDTLGRQLRTFLADNDVSTDYLNATDRPTSLAMVATNSDGHPEYRFYLESDVSLTEQQLPSRTEWSCVLVGSYSTVIEPSASTLETFVARCAPVSVIAYDPNIRPSIEPNAQVWRDKVQALGANADIIKLSDEDADFLASRGTAEDYARSLINLGPRFVVMTRGPKGALIFTSDGREIEVAGRVVDVVDTVGAGDTFQAALLHDINAQGMLSRTHLAKADIQSAVEFAIKAASVTCTRQGADLPTLGEVNAA